jgi:ABC-2 type transport system permease protein
MPTVMQWLGELFPLTYYITVVRGIALKDVGLAALWQPALALTIAAAILVTVSVARFTKTMD